MIDENNLAFGREKAEQDAGFRPAGHVTDDGRIMDKPPEPPKAEITIKEGAEELKRRTGQDAPITRVEVVDNDPERPISLTVEQAAKITADKRREDAERIDKPIEEFKRQEVADAIDTERGVETQSQRIARVEQERKAERDHYELLQRAADGFQREDQAKRANDIDAAEQRIRGQQIGMVQTIAHLAPELNNIRDLSQLPTAIAALEQRDPNRARQVKAHFSTLTQLNRQQAAVQNAKQQHANTRFQSYAKAQDAEFMRRHSSDADFKQVAAGVVDVLKDHGISVDEFARLANTPEGSFLRDARVHSLLYAMSRSRGKARSAVDIKSKLVRDVPPVVHPGTRNPGPVTGAAHTATINKALSGLKGDAAVRAAAQLLANKRRGGR
jgi:hypothetical protein